MIFRKILYVLVQKKQVEIYHAPPKNNVSIAHAPLKVSPNYTSTHKKTSIKFACTHTHSLLSFVQKDQASSLLTLALEVCVVIGRTTSERYFLFFFSLTHSSSLQNRTKSTPTDTYGWTAQESNWKGRQTTTSVLINYKPIQNWRKEVTLYN